MAQLKIDIASERQSNQKIVDGMKRQHMSQLAYIRIQTKPIVESTEGRALHEEAVAKLHAQQGYEGRIRTQECQLKLKDHKIQELEFNEEPLLQ